MNKLLIALLSLCLSQGACSKNEATNESSADESPKPTSGHAAANVTPGSHEDWCGEHAVPESHCTRCNPALAAAFKATDDWCAEHGLPESQCTKCNPEIKIERPPATGAVGTRE